jgi:hypothetical protein
LFNQLATLAEATELCVVFDGKYVDAGNRPLIQQLIDHPEQLSPFKARYPPNQFRRADASVFKATVDTEKGSTTEKDTPPPYYEVGNKRARQGEVFVP